MHPDDPADLLRLVQWLSPAFPLGGFAYSHGLETAIADGAVRTASDLAEWLEVVLHDGAGHSDAVLLAATRAGADPAEMDAVAQALAAAPERLEETRAQGAAFMATTAALIGGPGPALCLPVAVGLQSRGLRLGTPTVLGLYLQSVLGNLVLAAVRLVPLGQTEGQKVLSDLGPAIARQARTLEHATPDDLATATLGADLAAMAHEHQDVRLFRT